MIERSESLGAGPKARPGRAAWACERRGAGGGVDRIRDIRGAIST